MIVRAWHGITWIAAALVSVTLTSIIDPGELLAQSALTVEARAGRAIPFGDLDRFADDGPTLGIGLVYQSDATDKYGLRMDWEVSNLDGEEFFLDDGRAAIGRSMTIHRVSFGLEVAALNPDLNRSGWIASFGAGSGIANLRLEGFRLVNGIEGSYLSVYGNAKVGHQWRRWALFASGRGDWTLIDSSDFRDLDAVVPTDQQGGIGPSWVLPVTLGLRYIF